MNGNKTSYCLGNITLSPGNSVLIDLVQTLCKTSCCRRTHCSCHYHTKTGRFALHLVFHGICGRLSASVVVNFAIAVPRQCTARTFADTIPLFDSFFLNKRKWVYPSVDSQEQEIATRLVLAFMFRYFQNRINIKPNFLMTSPPFLQVIDVQHALIFF